MTQGIRPDPPCSERVYPQGPMSRTPHAPPSPAPPGSADAIGPAGSVPQPEGRPTPPERDELDLARAIIRAEADAVAGLSERLNASFTHAVTLIQRCAKANGNVLVTGLGKSGLIGAKISAMLASLGVSSHFVHPTEAAHGDLGNFRPSDLCIAISYSGETEEIVALAAILRQDAIPVIAITAGERASGLSRVASVTLDTGDVESRAALSPAPTVSTTAALVLGDALALCAAHRLGLNVDDFARRHPGGTLGWRLKPVTEALRFVVGRNLHPVPLGASVAEALRLTEADGRRPGAILVVDPEGRLTGLFTDGDLRRLVLKDPAHLTRPIDQVMTRQPSTLPDSARLADAERLVQASRRDEIPVVDQHGRPVGLLDVQDLMALRLVKE